MEGEAVASVEGVWEEELYQTAASVSTERVAVRAVPYFAWGHRDPGGMAVWLRETP